MLPDHIRLKHINHITYNVRNKDAALQWYQDILGLGQIPKMVNSDHLYWLQLPSGAMVHIIENADAPRRRPTTPRSRLTISRRLISI